MDRRRVDRDVSAPAETDLFTLRKSHATRDLRAATDGVTACYRRRSGSRHVAFGRQPGSPRPGGGTVPPPTPAPLPFRQKPTAHAGPLVCRGLNIRSVLPPIAARWACAESLGPRRWTSDKENHER